MSDGELVYLDHDAEAEQERRRQQREPGRFGGRRRGVPSDSPGGRRRGEQQRHHQLEDEAGGHERGREIPGGERRRIDQERDGEAERHGPGEIRLHRTPARVLGRPPGPESARWSSWPGAVAGLSYDCPPHRTGQGEVASIYAPFEILFAARPNVLRARENKLDSRDGGPRIHALVGRSTIVSPAGGRY